MKAYAKVPWHFGEVAFLLLLSGAGKRTTLFSLGLAIMLLAKRYWRKQPRDASRCGSTTSSLQLLAVGSTFALPMCDRHDYADNVGIVALNFNHSMKQAKPGQSLLFITLPASL